MKIIRLFISVLLLNITLQLYAQQTMPDSFEDRWWIATFEDALPPLNLTFSAGLPRLYSPMQSEQEMTPSKWSFANDTLRLSFNKLDLRFTLIWNDSSETFRGSLRQGLMKSDVFFSLSDGMYRLNRPQTPSKPYPYYEEEFVVVRKKEGVTLTGTLTIPHGKGPFPAVVLVSGSGQQNRDEEIMLHKPFLVLADYLTRHGISVLRYDDRGVGGSTGDYVNATTFDFADDAEAAFMKLRKDRRIDSRRIGILGHSEGAAIACIVASRNSKVSFAVMLGGQGCSGSEILLRQNELLYLGQGVPQSLVNVRLDCMREIFRVVDSVKEENYVEVFRNIIASKTVGLSDDECKQIGMRRSDAILWAQQMQMPWMKAFLKLDNKDYLCKVRCPLLAIGGTKDVQVPPGNIALIARYTKGKAVTYIMPGLNHLLQHCTTGLPNEYMLIEETMAPEVLTIISEWIGGL